MKTIILTIYNFKFMNTLITRKILSYLYLDWFLIFIFNVLGLHIIKSIMEDLA